MLGFLKDIFSSGIVGSIERIASEAIETDMESAEAKALFVKTLDPNGKMRRDLSKFACVAYGFYLFSTTILIFLHSFGVGDTKASEVAMQAMTDLFMPITTAWGGIVGASFGVNGVNSYKGRS
jgi:hypothetical protein